MLSDEIYKRFEKLSTDEEIEEFIKERINELESMSVEKTVGQNYTDSFRDYISSKVHYKAADNLGKDVECPDLVYDDMTPYIMLIKRLKKDGSYNLVTLMNNIFYVITEYLPNDDIGLGRALTYFRNKNSKVSIKEISENGVAFCSERSGMAHNMLKLFCFDSEVACGTKNN